MKTPTKPRTKGKDSINAGISKLQGYTIHVLPTCKHTIDEIYSCIPMVLWSKKQNNNTYIAIELYTMCYSKYCHDYYYIFVYMEKGVVMNSKIIRSEGTPIDSDTKIKHYMRNGLKY